MRTFIEVKIRNGEKKLVNLLYVKEIIDRDDVRILVMGNDDTRNYHVTDDYQYLKDHLHIQE
jgi:hypothetical protein